jgi:hypothetical protein
MDRATCAPAAGPYQQHLDGRRDQDSSNRVSKDGEALSLAETLTERRPSCVIEKSPAKWLSNHEGLDDLCKRIEDWKGYDVTTFGNLLLHGELQIVSSPQSERAKKVMISPSFISSTFICHYQLCSQGLYTKISGDSRVTLIAVVS